MARRDSNTGGTVAGVFSDRVSAEAAIHQLKDEGFLEQQLGVAARDQEQQEAIIEGTGTQGADDAAAGGLLQALVGLGIPEENARHFEQNFDRGGILLTVQSDGRRPLALEILAEAGGDIGPAYASGRADDNRSLDAFERRRGEEAAYAGPERRLASRR